MMNLMIDNLPQDSESLLDLQIAHAESIKRRKFSAYRKVIGKLPTKKEMADWGHDRWMDYLQFCCIYIDKGKRPEDEAFKFTEEKRKLIESYLDIFSHPFHEFIYRLDKWVGEDTDSKYRFRFQAMSRHILVYLKEHPSIISPAMRTLVQSYPLRLGWVLKQYMIQQTHAGDVVVRDGGTDSKEVALPSINQKMMETLVTMTDFYQRLAESIGEKDIKVMKLMEKVKVMKDFSFIFTTATKKQATSHLTQININTKNAKGVEETMLEYLKQSQSKD